MVGLGVKRIFGWARQSGHGAYLDSQHLRITGLNSSGDFLGWPVWRSSDRAATAAKIENPEDPDEYKAENVFWVPAEGQRQLRLGAAPPNSPLPLDC
jgi:hypothetical protein